MIHYITPDGVGSAWVGNELRMVHQAGIPFALHSIRAARQTFFVSDWAKRFHQATNVLYPLPRLGMVVSIVMAPILFRGRFAAALWNALTGERESLRARFAAFAHLFVACHWARQLRKQPVRLIHSQWAHSCGTVGMYGAWLLDIPFSFTGHAVDLYRDRVALRDKIRRAERIGCISTFHRDFYKKLGARDEQLILVYCGVDVDELVPPRNKRTQTPFRIISAGRLVEKKGFADLIDACARLAGEDLSFECVIAGDGPLYESLREQIARCGLDGRVRVTGKALKQEKLAEFMHSGDLFCLPCVQAPDGDIDGLPQMVVEAMACGIPAISTRLVGIPDLVVDGRTGLLVDPGRTDQLASAIRRIHDDRRLAESLARAGRTWVVERFDINRSVEPIIDWFRTRLQDNERLPHRVTQERPVVGADVGP